jgi:Lrp/AsnC family transcriptional regulator, leucine-responsive regulatory protein
MDEIDATLLRLLQRDCSRSYADLGREVGLSVTPVVERLKKLRARGHIRAHVALVEPHLLGLHVCAFVGVLAERASMEAAFVKEIVKRAEVQECHLTSGEYPILLKIRVADAGELERFVNENIKAAKGILRVRIDVTLSTYKETPAVPIHRPKQAPRF